MTKTNADSYAALRNDKRERLDGFALEAGFFAGEGGFCFEGLDRGTGGRFGSAVGVGGLGEQGLKLLLFRAEAGGACGSGGFWWQSAHVGFSHMKPRDNAALPGPAQVLAGEGEMKAD
jgi:hypothetical protein